MRIDRDGVSQKGLKHHHGVAGKNGSALVVVYIQIIKITLYFIYVVKSTIHVGIITLNTITNINKRLTQKITTIITRICLSMGTSFKNFNQLKNLNPIHHPNPLAQIQHSSLSRALIKYHEMYNQCKFGDVRTSSK